MSAYSDHFSDHAGVYARFRPRYPQALFDYLATHVRCHERAWDCGTGSGQAALALTRHFASVIASDPSTQQIANAERHARVTYLVAAAERPPLAAASCDLITVAQALHWFDTPRFFAAAKSILRAGGVMAVWCYELMKIKPQIDAVIDHYYQAVVGPYWPPQRRLVEEGYRSIVFPFEEWPVPSIAMEAELDLPSVLGYLDSWSAAQRYRKARGEEPQDVIRDTLLEAWGDPAQRRLVRWPVCLRIGGN
ncbi:MAG: class I SAM-dependent methyltransferase [Proteobacteria bacterium]|nr:MAG: class I SAM-dependent methyltransferase [Pseudomonadota bacterium]QKK11429.1 MAG: methyltransferase domain-containing protein [Pseudomonadota bacterium]